MSNNVSIDFGPVFRAIDSVRSDVVAVKHSVDIVQSDVHSTRSMLDDLRLRFEEFVVNAERTANVQRSETKLSGLKDDLEREFGHWQVVRRTTIGVLQAFDVGNVSNRTVGQISEELMISTPRYWLAPALVALASWSKDEEDLAQVSIEEAYQRDPKKTALFFALVLRRQGRDEMATRWLRHYFAGVDPAAISREFTVVFEAAAQGAFGAGGSHLAAEKLRDWVADLRSDDTVVEAQITRWEEFLAVQSLVIHPDDFPTLQQVSPEWPQLKWLIEHASALPEGVAHFEGVREKLFVGRGRAEDMLDDLLEQLVSDYDPEELPLRREIATHEAIIEEDGDKDRARQRAELAQEGLEETTDAVSLQTMLAMQPETLGASVKTQQIAIGASRGDIVRAVSRYTAHYRANVPPTVGIALSTEHSGFARAFGFPGWSTRTDVPEPDAVRSLTEVWNTAFQTYLDAQKVATGKFVLWGVIGGLAGLLFLFVFWPLGLLILLGTAAVIAFKYRAAKRIVDANIANLEGNRESAVQESILVLRKATAEFHDAGEYYSELDGKEDELIRIIETWPAGGTSSAKAVVA